MVVRIAWRIARVTPKILQGNCSPKTLCRDALSYLSQVIDTQEKYISCHCIYCVKLFDLVVMDILRDEAVSRK